MKTLHIISSVSKQEGGPIEGVIQLNAQLMKQYSGSREIVSLDRPNASYLKDLPLKVHAMGQRDERRYSWLSPLKRYGVSGKMNRWLEGNISRYDVVIVNGLWNYATLAASRILPKAGIPYFVYPHGMMDPWFRRRYPIKHALKQLSWSMCEGPLLSNAKAVLFTSAEERALAENAFFGHQYNGKIVGYGTSDPPLATPSQIEAFSDKLPGLKGRRFILFLSRIHPKKGCDLLLSAFADLAASYQDIDLVIAGPDDVGLKDRLVSQATAAGIAERVHWPGMLSGEAKWGAFRSAEAFILPSHQENFGIVVAEALACGTPVLISNKVNIWREIEQCGAGIVDLDNVQGTRTMLAKFLTLNHERRNTMARAARECFESNFDLSKAARNISGILTGL